MLSIQISPKYPATEEIDITAIVIFINEGQSAIDANGNLVVAEAPYIFIQSADVRTDSLSAPVMVPVSADIAHQLRPRDRVICHRYPTGVIHFVRLIVSPFRTAMAKE